MLESQSCAEMEALMSESQVLVLALPPGCWVTSDKSPTSKVGTAKKEAPLYRAPNAAKALHTGFSHLIHVRPYL